MIGATSSPSTARSRARAHILRPGLDGFGVATAAALLPLAIGTVTLAAWWVRAPLALEPSSPLWLMKANTALCTILVAFASLLVRADRSLRASRVLAALALAIATATLLEYATGRSLGIDGWLAADPSSSHPGRMSPWSAALYTLLATGIAFHASRLDRIADAATLAAGVALQLVWAGYLYDASALYALDRQTLVSPQTLVSVTSLGVALVAIRRDRGVLAVASRASAGGALLRGLLPVAWALPLLLGWLRLLAQWRDWIGTTMGVALFAVAQTLVLTALVYWFARRLDVADLRWIAERERREELEQFVPICAWTRRVRWHGDWVPIERFLLERFGIHVTHTISDEAAAELEARASAGDADDATNASTG